MNCPACGSAAIIQGACVSCGAGVRYGKKSRKAAPLTYLRGEFSVEHPTEACRECGGMAWSRRVGFIWRCDVCEPWMSASTESSAGGDDA